MRRPRRSQRRRAWPALRAAGPLAGVLLAGLALPLAGCGGSGGDGSGSTEPAIPGPLVVGVDALPESFDPARARSVGERAIAAAIGTPLLTYDRGTDADAAALRPALASELPRLSEDETEYRFALRPGLLYADGRIVTASDVERAIAHASRRAVDPEVRDVLAGIVGAPSADGRTLSGVRSDDRTGAIVVRLRAPDGRIPLVLADPATAPIPELPRAGREALPASTGPLRVARVTDTSVELVTNPLRAAVSTVPAARTAQVSVTTRASSIAALRAGTIDVDAEPRDDEAGDPLPEGIRSVEGATGELWTLLLAPRGALTERSTRREIADAIDRRSLLTDSDETGAAPACGLLPGYVVGAVQRDDCPPAPVRMQPGELPGVLGLAVPRPASGARSAGTTAALGVVRGALGSVVAAGGEVAAPDPLVPLAAGTVDAALVSVRPSLPHPGAWLAPIATVDGLLAREIPRETAGPLTGSGGRWASLERRAIDRVVAVPIAIGRRTLLAGDDVSASSVVVHPVLGLDLTALRRR